jgi:hypothetical protein
MTGDQFRVQELNPFMEWHLHASAPSLEVASKEANRIARMIVRKTRVLGEDGEVLHEVDPSNSSPGRATDEVSASTPIALAPHRSSTRSDEVRPQIPGSVRLGFPRFGGQVGRRSATMAMPTGLLSRGQRRQESGSGSSIVMVGSWMWWIRKQ